MFGIEAPSIWLAYLLCVLSTVLCVVYGIINWNRGRGEIKPEDKTWLEEEKEIEESL